MHFGFSTNSRILGQMDYIHHREAKIRIDFLQILETDVGLHIISFLDDPGDLVRASAVSPLWRQLVVEHRFAKKLFLKAFPQLSNVDIADTSLKTVNSVEGGADANKIWDALLWDLKVYAALFHVLTKSKIAPKDCRLTALGASSTDNYPAESMVIPLTSVVRYMGKSAYHSSIGQNDPDVPETLICKLRPGVWAFSEIQIQPSKAFCEQGNPIYSATAVRFRMGHRKPNVESDFRRLPLQNPADNRFEWTYTSPEYPVMQENRWQSFKLPEPVLSVNSFLQMGFLVRAQREKFGRLYYISEWCHVRAMGQPLSPAFEIDIVEPDRKVILKYYPEKLQLVLKHPARSLRNMKLLPPPLRNAPRPFVSNRPCLFISCTHEDDDDDQEDDEDEDY